MSDWGIFWKPSNLAVHKKLQTKRFSKNTTLLHFTGRKNDKRSLEEWQELQDYPALLLCSLSLSPVCSFGNLTGEKSKTIRECPKEGHEHGEGSGEEALWGVTQRNCWGCPVQELDSTFVGPNFQLRIPITLSLKVDWTSACYQII